MEDNTPTVTEEYLRNMGSRDERGSRKGKEKKYRNQLEAFYSCITHSNDGNIGTRTKQ